MIVNKNALRNGNSIQAQNKIQFYLTPYFSVSQEGVQVMSYKQCRDMVICVGLIIIIGVMAVQYIVMGGTL